MFLFAGSTTAPLDSVTEPPQSPAEENKPEEFLPPVETTPRPSYPTTSGPDDFKVVCYFTNWAWYR